MPRKKLDEAARRRCPQACGNCKRRKERCDGAQPCGRCAVRSVEGQCYFGPATTMRRPSRVSSGSFHISEDMADTSDAEKVVERLMNDNKMRPPQSPERPDHRQSSAAPVPHLSRLIRDATGKFMFIGDSANLSFLQNIRRLVDASIGSCDFVVDSLRYLMVETTPSANWINAHSREPVPKPTIEKATDLIYHYMLATNCVLDLFDEADLVERFRQWLEASITTDDAVSSIYYLILAIGAQTCPEDKDHEAESYFNYGRFLTASYFMDAPSIETIQSYALITMFMLGASRRNAAFMNLGIAVRAAYALGLHRKDVSDLFSSPECRARERLWKVIRILDLFMSSSLGRPPSTSETRDTTAKKDYSASASLCSIFETILTEVYSKRMVSAEVVEKISAQHRNWTARLQEGLGVDGIQPTNTLAGGSQPNIGLYHIKEAYYWTIVLLTRPFLIESVASHIAMKTQNTTDGAEPNRTSVSNQPLVDACVDSAVRTIDLLRGLDTFEKIPKRLPFVINSVFVSALVLGVAFFGDLDRSFPLERSISGAQMLLRRFRHSDAQARRNLMIIEYLAAACKTHVEKREQKKMDGYSHLVGGIFGSISNEDLGKPNQRNRTYLRRQTDDRSPSAQSNEVINRESGTTEQRYTDSERQQVRKSTQETNTNAQWSGIPARPDDANAGFDHALSNGVFEYQDPMLSTFSPQTLWFDSFVDNNPLFSTVTFGSFE